MLDLTESELSNLIIACKTSKMRDGHQGWIDELNAISEKLSAERSRLDTRAPVPGEWVMVPREITADMMGAFHHAQRVFKTVPEIWSHILSAAPAFPTEGDLSARMKAAGMHSVQELLSGNLPLDKWSVHRGITDIKSFGEWLERKAREYLIMKAGYEIGDKPKDDELYEWVLGHYGAYHDVLVNFHAALASIPASET